MLLYITLIQIKLAGFNMATTFCKRTRAAFTIKLITPHTAEDSMTLGHATPRFDTASLGPRSYL